MAYTNAQLLRREIGDGGIFVRDVDSGDGTRVLFWLRSSQLIADSETVLVGGVVKTRTTDYTVDPETGALTFVVAPAAGTENVEARYRACEVSDGDITEALRQKGITASATADTGPTSEMLAAGFMLADWVASKLAYEFDTIIDGQSLMRSQKAKAWAERATALQDRVYRMTGIRQTQLTPIDGYNIDEVTMRDVLTTQRNVRQRFYYVGDLDRYP